jgi:hypothetical protein
METTINHDIIDKTLDYFYKIYPDGGHIENRVSNLTKKEIADLQTLLIDHEFLEPLGQKGYYLLFRLTAKGKELKDEKISFKDYLKKYQKQNEEQDRISKLNIERLENETKLSKWKIRTFWWIFIFGLFGGIYSIYSIIEKTTQEKTEDKINRILELKLKDSTLINHSTIITGDSTIKKEKK